MSGESGSTPCEEGKEARGYEWCRPAGRRGQERRGGVCFLPNAPPHQSSSPHSLTGSQAVGTGHPAGMQHRREQRRSTEQRMGLHSFNPSAKLLQHKQVRAERGHTALMGWVWPLAWRDGEWQQQKPKRHGNAGGDGSAQHGSRKRHRGPAQCNK